MIYFCNDRIRGMDDKQSAIYVKMFVEFRGYLSQFQEGNDLKVFMCIALHANSQGWAEVTIKTIQRETGIKTPDAVIASVKRLYQTVIQGKRILLGVKTRAPGSKKFLPNKYLIFPTDRELLSLSNSGANTQEQPTSADAETPLNLTSPDMADPDMGEPDRRKNPSLEDNNITPPDNNDVTRGSAGTPGLESGTQSDKIINAASDGESLARFYENPEKPLTPRSLDLLAGAYNAGAKRKDMRDRINEITTALRGASVKYAFGVMWNNTEIKDAIKQVAGRGDEVADIVFRVVDFVESGRRVKDGAWQYVPPSLVSQMILRDTKPGTTGTTQDKIRDASSDQDKANLSYAGQAIKS